WEREGRADDPPRTDARPTRYEQNDELLTPPQQPPGPQPATEPAPSRPHAPTTPTALGTDHHTDAKSRHTESPSRPRTPPAPGSPETATPEAPAEPQPQS